MANVKISALPTYSAATTIGTWLVLNTSGQTETNKIQKENFISNTYVTVTGVTIQYTGWTYNTATTYYEYAYSNTGITTTSVVNFTPYNTSVYTVLTARVQPYNSVGNATSTFYSQYPPNANITGDINIFKQTL
jgi:hypothetical protein